MKRLEIITLLSLSILTIWFSSCKNSDEEDLLSNSYAGLLTVEYTKGFPAFTSIAKLDVEIQKDGTVTFTGGGDNDSFNAEDIYYEGGKPVTKIKMTGTLTFHGAQGEVMILDSKEYVLISVSSSIDGQMTVWGWDDDLGWIQVFDLPFDYEDNYSDGNMQFSLLNASSGEGESIKKTLPDIQGTFTYGYKLDLIVIPG